MHQNLNEAIVIHTSLAHPSNQDTDSCMQPNESQSGLAIMLMLSSSNLPIGSYTYSQGIESAIQTGIINDEATAMVFLQDYAALVLIGFDLPLLALLWLSLQASAANATHESELAQACTGDGSETSPTVKVTLTEQLALYYHASRESKEFAFESQQVCHALIAWIDEVLNLDVPASLAETGYLPLFAHLCHYCGLSLTQTLISFAFTQLENMVLATVKTLPLGQMAGQRLLWQLQTHLQAGITAVEARTRDAFTHQQSLELGCAIGQRLPAEALMADTLIQALSLSNALPYLAILSTQHETQYSRLFRS